jgi:Spy/CpxP family protein refolding chaperone
MNHLARLITLATLTGTMAFAQQAPPPPAQGAPDQQPHGRMGGGPGGPARGMEGRREGGGMREGMHGMWWKNPELATRIGLTPEQTKKMDDIFQSSRLKLIDLKANVEKQEVTLEPMLSANPVDTKAALAQIGRVADARAELEKANGGMLLGIRAVLTPEQWTKFHEHDHEHGGNGPRHPGGMSKLEGPAAPGPARAMIAPPDAE